MVGVHADTSGRKHQDLLDLGVRPRMERRSLRPLRVQPLKHLFLFFGEVAHLVGVRGQGLFKVNGCGFPIECLIHIGPGVVLFEAGYNDGWRLFF